MDGKQPYFVAPHFSLGAEGRHWHTYTPAYQSIVTGAKATLLHHSGAASSWLLALASEHDVSSIAADVLSDLKLRNDLIALGLDPRTGEQNGTLNTLAFEWQQSTADDRLNAHRGYLLAVHIEQAGRIVPGTFNYWAASADGRHYLSRGRAIVWANRLQIGIVDAAGHDQVNVPFSKRYFLGGATSIRGWGRYEVSPLSGSGLPMGGDSMFAFTSELRTAPHGNLSGVVFLDAGNVWADAWGFRLGDLRYAVGSGLRYQTPIGPARFDIGYQLNPIPGLLLNGKEQTRRWRIHFSIGQAF
jgi:outer membrane translocation and assembly module TamA